MFPYALIDGDHLEITLADIPVSSGYTVTLETNKDLGAVVEFTTAPATGQVLAISRATPITQLEDFVAGSNFPGSTFEGALDKLTMIIQERGFVCGDCVPLDAPIILSATANGTDQIDLVWTDTTTDETGFELQRSLDGSTGWTVVALPIANATTHSDTGLADDTQYFYRLRATGGVLESDWSNTVNATTDLAVPAAPSGLSATQTGTTTIDLAWTDNSDNETSFEIQRSLDGSTGWTTVLTPAANATTASDSLLTEGTQYFYRIRATNAAGSSAWSNTANDFTLPAAPSSLVATAVSDTEIDLTWVDNSAAETSFSIERSLDGSTGWTGVLTPAANATSASDTGLTASTQYFYRIKALRSGDSSAYSNTDSATTEAPPAVLIAHYIGDSFADGATWDDETINNHDLTKNGNPVNVAAFNGTIYDAVEFDNVGDYFTVTSLPVGLFEDDNGECTVIIVFKNDSTVSSYLLHGTESVNNDRVQFGYNPSGAYFFTRRRDDTVENVLIGANVTGFAVGGFRINGTAITIRRNELGDDAVNDPTGTMTDIDTVSFGAQPGFSTSDFDGQIAEILVYSGAMPDSQWNSKFEELGTKYGITVTPHP